MGYSTEVLADAPVAYWRLGEASGTTAADSSGNGRSGVYQNTPTLGVAGVVPGNTAVRFDKASSEYLLSSFSWSHTDVLTIEAWVKRNDLTSVTRGIYALTSPANDGSISLYMETDGKIAARRQGYGNPMVQSTTTITDQNWHHVVYTKNASVQKIYIDGVDRTGTVVNQTLTTRTTAPMAGQAWDNTGGSTYGGLALDEVAYYSSALSSARVTAHYNAAFGPATDFTYTTSPAFASFTDASVPASGTTITAWSWTLGDGGTSTLANPTHTYSAGGTYSVTLTATDSNSQSNSITKSVTVPPPAPNQPPTAYFTSSTGSLTVNFTDQSTDPDGTIVFRAWDFGDGGTSTAANPSHTYAATGPYTVSLTVTDDDGATNTYSRSIMVRTAGSANSYVTAPIFLRESTLTQGIDATQTTIPVADLSYWPPNGPLWPSKNEGMLDPEGAAEKITWTAKSATHGPGELTGVTRGAFGTTAASHSSGKIIGLYGRHDAGLKMKGKIPLFPVNASLTLQELRRHFDSERFVWADFDNLNESVQLEIIGAPMSTGNVSTTLDEGGTAVQRNAGVTSAKEVRSLTIGAGSSSSGRVLVTLDDVIKAVPLSGAKETWSVQITHGPGGAGAVDDEFHVFLDGITYAVPYLATDTASQVAAKVRTSSYPSWTVSGSGTTIIFQGANYLPRSFSCDVWSSTGLRATRTQLAGASSLATVTQVADEIRFTHFDGWQTGGSGTTVTFTALEPGTKTGTFSYANNGTGATGTLSQITAGTQSTPAQVATAIRALYSGNTYWTVGGSGAIVTWDATSSGPKLDATFTPGTTGTAGNMQTVHQGSADIVGYLTDSGGVQQTRRLVANLATTTVFNLEASVSGAGTEHGIISFWGSFGTDPLALLWRVEDLDLTEYLVEEGAYGVTSESTSGLTWDVRTDEVELTDRGKTYYRDHNLRGQLLGQLHYFGILEPEQARDDIGVQDLWHPVMPGQQISLAFYMRYENMPVAFPSQPLFISFHHADGTVTQVGDASGLVGLSGDAGWAEHTTPTFSAPTLDENPVPAYWMRIQSKQMSTGTLVVQEINPSLGTVVTRTPYYAFEGTFRAQLDARTPKETPYLLLERQRTVLEAQFEENGGVVTPQYRSASDPASFDGTWYPDASQVPDLPVIDVDVALAGDGLSTPEVTAGYPRTEYRARPSKRHLFLKGDRTELPGGVIMDKVADWYRKPGTSQVLLPSGHTLKQKLNEPVGYLPSFELWAFRPETVKYLLENLNAVGVLFYAEVFNELLLLKVLTPEPKFTRASLSRFDNEDFGDSFATAASRYSFWVSDALSAEVMDVTEISE